jgi:excisionase family DNA binding protein
MTTTDGLPPGLFFKVEDVQALCRRGRTAVYADLAAGRLASIRVGRSRLVPRAALLAYAARLEAGASE